MNKNLLIRISSFTAITFAFIVLVIYYSKALPNSTSNRFEEIFYNNFDSSDMAKDTIEKSFKTESIGVLFMETDGADVKIESWEKNEVNVLVERKGNQEKLENYKITFSNSPNKVEVLGKMEKKFWDWGGFSVKFIVKVPKQFSPEIRTSGGDIYIKGINAKVLGKTSGGDVNVLDCVGNLEINTSGGDVEMNRITGDINVGTSGGDIKLIDTEGGILAETSGGDVHADFKGVNKGLLLKTSGGDITISLPSDTKGNIDCSTSGGDVKLNVSGGFSGEVKESKIKGTLNGGGEEIKARTSGGDIVITAKSK